MLTCGIVWCRQAFGLPVVVSLLLLWQSVHGVAGRGSVERWRAARTLQQEVADSPAAQVTRVSTPGQLEAAIQAGARDVVIVNHLDLTGLVAETYSACAKPCKNPLGLVEGRSIRGNCSADLPLPPAGGDLALSLRPRQCVLVSETDMFTVTAAQFWMDNLYLRVVHPLLALGDPGRAGLFASLLELAPGVATVPGAPRPQGEHYVSNVTFEGDGFGPSTGIWADSDVYVEDGWFTRLGGTGLQGCLECSAALLARAQVTLVGCAFSALYGTDGSAFIRAESAGNVMLRRTTFTLAPVPLKAGLNSAFFADDESLTVIAVNGHPVAPQPLANAPSAAPLTGARFLREDDPWFLLTRHELTGSPLPPASGSGSGFSVGVVAGVVVAVLCAVAAALVLWLFVRRRRRDRALRHAHEGSSAMASPYLGHPPLPPSQAMMVTHPEAPSSQQSKGSSVKPLPSMPSWQSASARGGSAFQSMACGPGTQGATTATGGTLCTTWRTASTPPPSTTAPTAEKLEYLHTQLNLFTADDVVLDRFKMLGEWERRQGGQGIVAFATGTGDRLGYAIKFFVTLAAFAAERQLYESRVLGALLPKIEDVYDPADTPARFRDRHGQPLPPCMVMERGESLNEWSRRAKPDVFQAVAVLAHVATRLRDMHQAGYVHRDIKPSNIMLLPRENRWTVIDFGSAAQIGVVAPMSYTLVYAAPEIAATMAGGASSVVVDPAVDAWALGVVAFELLSGLSTFDVLNDGKTVVMEQLQGSRELPWEGARLRAQPAVRKRLGVFKKPVLALLHRDPGHRASMADFCAACDNLFSSPTTAEDVSVD
eukprot:jgi/Ulvmu1/12562/UM091_0003.1